MPELESRYSELWFGCACVSVTSVMSDSVTLWTVARQAPLSMGFPRQAYWNGLPCPPRGDLPNPGIEPHLLQWWAESLPLAPPGKPTLLQTVCYKEKKSSFKKRPNRILNSRYVTHLNVYSLFNFFGTQSSCT